MKPHKAGIGMKLIDFWDSCTYHGRSANWIVYNTENELITPSYEDLSRGSDYDSFTVYDYSFIPSLSNEHPFNKGSLDKLIIYVTE